MATAAGWTLLHSLWEGAAVAAALAIALAVIRSSRFRYAAAGLAMLAMLAGFVVTFEHVMPGARIQRLTVERPITTPPTNPWVPRKTPKKSWQKEREIIAGAKARRWSIRTCFSNK